VVGAVTALIRQGVDVPHFTAGRAGTETEWRSAICTQPGNLYPSGARAINESNTGGPIDDLTVEPPADEA
jgi:hypothetical protein